MSKTQKYPTEACLIGACALCKAEDCPCECHISDDDSGERTAGESQPVSARTEPQSVEITEVLAGRTLPDSAKWLLLYAEARASMCSCNKTDTPELGPEYDYTCDWCERHPEGDWDSVKAALEAAAQSLSAQTPPAKPRTVVLDAQCDWSDREEK